MANTNQYLDYEGLRYYHGKLQDQIDADHALIAQALEALDEKTEIQIGGETPTSEDIKLYIDENSEYATVYTAAQTESLINEAKAQIPTRVSQLTNDSNYATSSQVDARIQQVVGAAPAALDTLEEIASKLGDDSDAIAGIIDTLEDKADKADVEALELGEINVQSDWNQTDDTEDDYIKNKPTNVSAFTNDAGYLTQHQDISGKANSADLATVATSGSYNDLSNKPTIPAAQIQSDWNQADDEAKDFIKNKPTIPTVPTNVSAFTNDAGYLTQHQDISGKANSADLATVATSGSYDDLSNKPTIPAAQIQSDWNQTDNTAKDFIKNKPTIVPAEVEIVADDTATIAADTKIVIEEDTDGLDTLVYTKAQTDSAINTRIQEVIGAAPAALDTLEEIAAKLGDDDNAIAAITNTLSQKANSADLATVATSGSYNDLSDKPTIPTVPTNVSAFTNDAGYLTSETPEVQINGTPASGIKLLVDETADASVEVYSKAQVDAMIANIYQILINNGLTV